MTQMLWGVSGVALYVPWAGGAGPWISISLWLWLGVLDAVQGVGLGVVLLQTLSRLQVGATLAFSQMLGSSAVCSRRLCSESCWCVRLLLLSGTSGITG